MTKKQCSNAKSAFKCSQSNSSAHYYKHPNRSEYNYIHGILPNVLEEIPVRYRTKNSPFTVHIRRFTWTFSGLSFHSGPYNLAELHRVQSTFRFSDFHMELFLFDCPDSRSINSTLSILFSGNFPELSRKFLVPWYRFVCE